MGISSLHLMLLMLLMVLVVLTAIMGHAVLVLRLAVMFRVVNMMQRSRWNGQAASMLIRREGNSLINFISYLFLAQAISR